MGAALVYVGDWSAKTLALPITRGADVKTPMKAFLPLSLLFAMVCSGFAAPPTAKPSKAKPAAARPSAVKPPANMRTISNLTALPKETLKRLISPKFYKSLLISPVEGFIVVPRTVDQRPLRGRPDRAFGVRRSLRSTGANPGESLHHLGRGDHGDWQLAAIPVHQYLLIYKIADGTMAVSFPAIAESGGNQGDDYGSAFLAVRGKDGKWTEI